MHAHVPADQICHHGIPGGGEVDTPAHFCMVGEVDTSFFVHNAAIGLPAVVVERVGGDSLVRV